MRAVCVFEIALGKTLMLPPLSSVCAFASVICRVRVRLLTKKYQKHTIYPFDQQSDRCEQMQFGSRVRELREGRSLTQKELADNLGVSTSYISKVENERLHFGDYPSEKFIHKLADELDADESELLLLTDRVPEHIRAQIRQRPELFEALAQCNDDTLDRVYSEVQKSLTAKGSGRPA